MTTVNSKTVRADDPRRSCETCENKFTPDSLPPHNVNDMCSVLGIKCTSSIKGCTSYLGRYIDVEEVGQEENVKSTEKRDTPSSINNYLFWAINTGSCASASALGLAITNYPKWAIGYGIACGVFGISCLYCLYKYLKIGRSGRKG